jgi:hypothetical protein
MLSPRFGKFIKKELYKNGQRFHIYLSGPMTGLPDYNRPAFDEMATTLRSQGKTVFNPAEVGPREIIQPRAWYMKKDIEALLKSDSIYMMFGWESSEGARLEFEIAKQLELPIIIHT